MTHTPDHRNCAPCARYAQETERILAVAHVKRSCAVCGDPFFLHGGWRPCVASGCDCAGFVEHGGLVQGVLPLEPRRARASTGAGD